MRKTVLRGLVSVVLASLNLPATAQVTGTTLPNFDKPWAQPDSYFKPPRKAFPDHLKYGKSDWQRIEFFRVKNGSKVPVVVVLGAVSEWGQYRINQAGYAVASLPKSGRAIAKVPERLTNAVDAISYLRQQAAELNIDPDRIILYGPGSAANSALLLGTDPTLLEGGGVPFASIRAVVTGNGEGYDIPKRISESSFKKQRYEKNFGNDPEEQVRLSPISHLAPPNASAFLMFVAEDAVDIRPETDEMAAAAAKAGIDVQVVELPKPLEKVRRTIFLAEPDGSGKDFIPFLREQFGQ